MRPRSNFDLSFSMLVVCFQRSAKNDERVWMKRVLPGLVVGLANQVASVTALESRCRCDYLDTLVSPIVNEIVARMLRERVGEIRSTILGKAFLEWTDNRQGGGDWKLSVMSRSSISIPVLVLVRVHDLRTWRTSPPVLHGALAYWMNIVSRNDRVYIWLWD